LLARGVDSPTRAKVAEALAGHPEAVDALRGLLRDPDAQVRANALWALGAVGTVREVAGVSAYLRDDDVTVAANAAAALGRLGARRADVARPLCGALSDARSAVRASALRALSVAGHRCPEHPEAGLLANDPSEQVRAAAARLLRSVPARGSGDDARALERAGRRVLETTGMQAVLITRGGRGMALFVPDEPTVHIPIFGSDEIADVTGAGDTVMATMTLALASGASFEGAARLANYAGGMVVMKRGTATVSADELRRAVRQDSKRG